MMIRVQGRSLTELYGMWFLPKGLSKLRNGGSWKRLDSGLKAAPPVELPF